MSLVVAAIRNLIIFPIRRRWRKHAPCINKCQATIFSHMFKKNMEIIAGTNNKVMMINTFRRVKKKNQCFDQRIDEDCWGFHRKYFIQIFRNNLEEFYAWVIRTTSSSWLECWEMHIFTIWGDFVVSYFLFNFDLGWSCCVALWCSWFAQINHCFTWWQWLSHTSWSFKGALSGYSVIFAPFCCGEK